jgi:hypothetical protein
VDDRPIIVDVEELPAGHLAAVILKGTFSEGDVNFKLTVTKSVAPMQGTGVELSTGRSRFEKLNLTYLPFESIDVGRISTHSKAYAYGRVFRVRLRYGEPNQGCQIGDDGRGKVTITYLAGRRPEVTHRPPITC